MEVTYKHIDGRCYNLLYNGKVIAEVCVKGDEIGDIYIQSSNENSIFSICNWDFLLSPTPCMAYAPDGPLRFQFKAIYSDNRSECVFEIMFINSLKNFDYIAEYDVEDVVKFYCKSITHIINNVDNPDAAVDKSMEEHKFVWLSKM